MKKPHGNSATASLKSARKNASTQPVKCVSIPVRELLFEPLDVRPTLPSSTSTEALNGGQFGGGGGGGGGFGGGGRRRRIRRRMAAAAADSAAAAPAAAAAAAAAPAIRSRTAVTRPTASHRKKRPKNSSTSSSPPSSPISGRTTAVSRPPSATTRATSSSSHRTTSIARSADTPSPSRPFATTPPRPGISQNVVSVDRRYVTMTGIVQRAETINIDTLEFTGGSGGE